MFKIKFDSWNDYREFIAAFNAIVFPTSYVWSNGFDFENKRHCFIVRVYDR